ncbi:MAG: GntR family transcriptional regulator [Phycisphaerae bacterium]|nr:GntR family transcriptional regulator [Phycisphaerae bacterium]
MPVDPNSHVPIYEQIVGHIRGSVAAGVFRPGESLPSIRALALDLVVTPNTVQRAYQELERQGLVYTRKGLGVFVTEGGHASAQTRSQAAVRDMIAQAVTIARAASLPPHQIEAIFRQALADGRPKPPPHNPSTDPNPGHEPQRPDAGDQSP